MLDRSKKTLGESERSTTTLQTTSYNEKPSSSLAEAYIFEQVQFDAKNARDFL